jgi:phenylalanyl-tRNA synthetase alpha chain
MIDELERIAADARAAIEAAPSLDALAEAERTTLGKKGSLKAFKRELGRLEPEERKAVGQAVNEALAALEAVAAERRRRLEKGARAEQLEADRLDLTEVVGGSRAGHLHLVTQATMELEDVFVGLGFTVAEGPEVETDFYNFEALNFPEGHPARDMYDTLYVDFGEPGRTLLRTHTSPVQVRVMQEQAPPIYSVMPGRTFRQDTADATHLPVFHQIEGLVVDRGITLTDLAGTIDRFTKAYFGGDFSSRLRPSYFPFTEPSAEFDIIRPDGTFLELGGCGMVHPNVLRNCGIDAEEFTGFAFGFGIERLAITKAGVDDLRELITNDVRFLRQF